ncbi:MAG: hypothetical protein P1V51_01545 [Deltaproteobacteria bacterium]|nr:hypothetical protein [Deltaproteobacteria bacterium]
MRVSLLLALLLAPLLAGCPPIQPCTDCLEVAGEYLIRAQPIDGLSGGGPDNPCGAVAFPGVNDRLLITQAGSQLTASGWMELDGTLYEDDSLILGPEHYLQTAQGEVLLSLTGLFVPARDGWVVQGQVVFDIPMQACTTSTPLELVQQP